MDLSTIPASVDVGGGFHNFGTASSPAIAQPLLIQGNPSLILQWNDPFDVGKITSSYSLLLFDQNGKYIKASDTLDNASSDDDAFQTDEPIQGIAFDTTATKGQAFYYLVIARHAEGTHEAKRIKWLSLGAGAVIAAYQTISTPVTFGHSTARHAIGVAAYNVNRAPFSPDPPYTPEIEYFSSPVRSSIISTITAIVCPSRRSGKNPTWPAPTACLRRSSARNCCPRTRSRAFSEPVRPRHVRAASQPW